MSKTALAVTGYLLLTFTDPGLSWAEGTHAAIYGDDDVAVTDAEPDDAGPGTRDGPSLRLGTLAGYAVFAGERIGTVGGYVAAGTRLGPVVVEGECDHLVMYTRDPNPEREGNIEVGRINRVAAIGRLDLGGPGPSFVGPNSKLVFWLEAGLGMQLGRWARGEVFRRYDQSAGAGLLLDHRFKRPLGFPSRVGWHFSWRLTRAGDLPATKSSYMAPELCKAERCTPSSPRTAVGLLVSSGLHFSW